jgi:hypothetical protein
VSDVPVNGPGFISIIVSNVPRSAAFYEEHCGAVRDPFFVKHKGGVDPNQWRKPDAADWAAKHQPRR